MSDRRVLIVSKNPLGGIRTYTLANCRYLLDKGYRFTFVSPRGTAFDGFKDVVTHWPDVQCIDGPVNNSWGQFSKFVSQIIRNVKPVLIHSQGLRAGTEVVLGNLLAPVSHIITLHDVIVPENDIPGRFKWLKKRIIGGLTRRATIVIPVSSDCSMNHRALFPEWDQGPCRVEVINNGVDVQRLVDSKKCSEWSLYEKFSLSHDIVMIGFFGRFMPQKGLDVLLDAMRGLNKKGYLEKIRLMATKDPHGYRNEYMNYVERDPLLKRCVCFIDPVDDIGCLLSQMDALVMPSRWEACPLLPAEAMVLGVPVIGSDAIGLREVLAGTPSRVVPVGDVSALVNEISAMIENPMKTQAEKFIPEAIKRFDNAVAGEKLLSLYDQVADWTGKGV